MRGEREDMENNNPIEYIPEHIGIIMDGNRRWAKRNNLPIGRGHNAGINTLRMVIRKCSSIGVKYLTVFVLSTDNLKRDKKEVDNLYHLIQSNLQAIDFLIRENVKIKIIGDRSGLSKTLLKTIENVESSTVDCNGIVLSLCFNYGGQDEIVAAFKKIIADDTIKHVTVESFEKNMYSSFLPEPEMIIRTGGEKRTSGFLLWKSAYSELVFCDKYWPDFTEEDLINMIIEYNKREINRGR